MTPLAGELTIDLATRDGVVSAVEVASTRPLLADRLFAGRPPEQALALVPQVYSICGRSQAIAAELALQAARGGDSGEIDRRVSSLETEIAQETLWRALLDWPREVGADADTAAVAALRRALAVDPAGAHEATRATLREVAERAVLGGAARDWFEHEHVPAFEIWIARAATPAARYLGAVQRDGPRHGAPRNAQEVPLLPSLAQPQVAAQIAAALAADENFARAPQLVAPGPAPAAGRCAETGAVGRCAGHPLVAALLAVFGRSTLARLAARLTELARIAAAAPAPSPMCGALSVAPRVGLGWVETARGALAHLIELDADGARIARYRILAPTEWNFHPRGALAAGLLGVHEPRRADLRRRALWLLQALDPCVEHTLRIDGERVAPEST
jgi:hypothetical protein